MSALASAHCWDDYEVKSKTQASHVRPRLIIFVPRFHCHTPLVYLLGSPLHGFNAVIRLANSKTVGRLKASFLACRALLDILRASALKVRYISSTSCRRGKLKQWRYIAASHSCVTLLDFTSLHAHRKYS